MKLDLIFSIGPACRPAYYLKMNFLRTFACPLDWQMNYSLDTCLHMFQTNFETFFTDIQEDVHRKGAHNNRRIIDTRNSITSIHHFDSDTPLPDAQAAFRAIMQKRYLQLHTAILRSHVVGLICNREDSLDDLSTFLSSFGQLYTNVNFILINIRNTEGLTSACMNEYHLNPKLTIREYSFHDQCLDKKSMEERAWLGNFEIWNSVLQDYYLSRHPFADYIKDSVSNNRSIHLYGAGIYCHKLIHFLKNHSLNISNILVTSSENNPDAIEKIPVITCEHITEQYYDDLIIISVVNSDESLKIYNLLRSRGIKSVVRIDALLRIIS